MVQLPRLVETVAQWPCRTRVRCSAVGGPLSPRRSASLDCVDLAPLCRCRSRCAVIWPSMLALMWIWMWVPAIRVWGADEGPTSFVVAAMRVEPRPWDKAHNFKLLVEHAREAARRGAQLVVTCEGFLDGYTANPNYAPGLTRERYFAIGETLDGPWLRKVADLCRELRIHVALGFAERRGEQMFNSLVVYSDAGERVLHYAKVHTVGEPFNSVGNAFPIGETRIGKLGALICYDRRFPEVSRILALKGAHVLLIPAYGRDGERNEALLRTRAWENSVWVVYVKQNQALVIQPNGKIIARDAGQGDELVLARIVIDDDVGSGDITQRRVPLIYREIVEQRSTED